MKVSRWGGLVAACCLTGVIALAGCRREQPPSFDSNLPPDTYISFAPAESTFSYYRVRLFWNGVDPDGMVDHYEYALTDTNETPGQNTPGFNGYFRTTNTDSLFVMRADLPQLLGHRFYIRAVDNEDKVDPTPAWTYFVAHDYNFPNVAWSRSIGRWNDRNGNPRSVVISSFNLDAPTDTVGVAGEVDFTWGGFDVDPGGFIVGYEYRTATGSKFLGGTLADSAFTRSYVPLPGERYYSGRDGLRVRAIDDAGARTSPDSVRSYVVNFGPHAWILDAANLQEPVPKRTFIDMETGSVWPSGTILPDGLKEIQFHFTGLDDERDVSLDPVGNPTGISRFQFRKLKGGGGPAWQNITDFEDYPERSQFKRAEAGNLSSGTYVFLIRARDELDRFGLADTLIVGVNYFPYFTAVTYLDGFEERPLWNPSGDVLTVTIHRRPDGTYPDFTVRYVGSDTHDPPPDTHPLDVNTVVEPERGLVEEYLSRLNGARDGYFPADSAAVVEKIFPVSDATSPPSGYVRSGENSLELKAKDDGGRETTLVFSFIVTLADTR